MGLEPLEDVDAVEQRRVLNDDGVGFDDRLVQSDGSHVDPAEGHDGCPAALGAEARERLRVLALEERRDAQELGRRDRALSSAPVDANLEHHLSLAGPLPPMARSTSSTRSVVRTSASALRLIESMPRSTRKAAKSGKSLGA